MIRKTILGALLLSIPTFVGCQRSPADDQQAVDEAQRKADDVAAKARSDAEMTAALAQAKVDDEARRAGEAFSKAREELRVNTQRDIDAVSKRLDEIEARMNKVTGRRHAELAAALKELDEKRASLQQALASIDAVSPQGFEALKSTLNARIDELRKAVDQLNTRT